MPEIKVQLTSKLTKKFLEHERSALRDYITKELGASINTHGKGANFVQVVAEDDAVLEKAELFMLAFDSRIGALAQNNSIGNKEEILPRHIGFARVDAEDLLKLVRAGNLNQIKKEIKVPEAVNSNTPTLKDSFTDARENAPASQIPFVPSKEERKALRNAVKAQDASKVKTRSISYLPFEPKNKNSAIAMEAIMAPETSIIFMVGPAGTSKTFTPMHAAVQLYNAGKIDSVEIIKPRTTTGKGDIGALKGGLEEKMAPYTNAGIGSNFFKITNKTLGSQSSWVATKTADFERGESKENRLVIIDEAQNLTVEQAKLLITRVSDPDVAKYTKFVLTGDISGNQADLRGELPGLTYLINHLGEHIKLKDSKLRQATAFIQFTKEDSIARSKLLPDILEALDSPSNRLGDLMKAYQDTMPNAARQRAVNALTDFSHSILQEVAAETKLRYEKQAREAYPYVFGDLPAMDAHRAGPRYEVA